MTKQEFLAFSLPYDVKAIDTFSCIWTIHAYKDALDNLRDNEHLSYENFIMEEGHRLILHPLSDLTKPIEHKGEKFVPIIELIKIKYSILLDLQDEDFSIYTDGYPRACYTTNAIWEIMINPYYLPNEEFWIIQKLIEWHFNLMDIGEEFIDVNTLEENPYK